MLVDGDYGLFCRQQRLARRFIVTAAPDFSVQVISDLIPAAETTIGEFS